MAKETPEAEQFRERVLANWTDPQTVAAWRRWHGRIARQQQHVSNALLAAAQLGNGSRVLDLASGSGEPALHIARAVGPTGSVVATDVSSDMLDLARQRAREQGASNVEFVVCDAESLPFEDATFDAVTSRMGAMFFVDLHRSLQEVRRVLRRGGRAAFSAWGPQTESSFFMAIVAPFAARCDPPKPPPGAPHAFRFAEQNTFRDALIAAGFHDVAEERRTIEMPWFGPPEEWWEAFYELAAPPYFDQLPEEQYLAAKREGIENLHRFYRDGAVRMQAAVVIASAQA
jgi:ubiquinone/menaquinone biosynthesis C-methylase UbiE